MASVFSDAAAPSLSVIVPVYNSAASLPILLERLAPVLSAQKAPFEVILVNDGSRDDSWKVVLSLTQQYPWVQGIQLMRNYGQHNALLCGIRAARYDVIVTMDDDLQHPPEELPKLLEKLAQGFDVVYGSPEREPHGLWRGLASQTTKWALQRSMGQQVARQISAWRVFRTELRAAFADFDGPYVSIDVLLTWATTAFAAVRVRHDPRRIGVSNYTFGKLLTHALNLATGFSTLPLRVATLLGFAFTLFGMGILVFVGLRYVIAGSNVHGFTFLASIISLFAGVQMFVLGIMGEYLARMHFRMLSRPCYAVRQEVRHVQKAAA